MTVSTSCLSKYNSSSRTVLPRHTTYPRLFDRDVWKTVGEWRLRTRRA